MKLADLARNIPLSTDRPIPDGMIVSGITEDSRRVKPGMVFAALSGTRSDGLSFVNAAIAQGAVAVLTSPAQINSELPILTLKADEPRLALALMAAKLAGSQPKIIAAITGTNGKTSVAAFLRQIWLGQGIQAASLGTIGIVTADAEISLNHTTPDPVTLHRHLADLAEGGITHLAIEASSHGLAQYRLDGVNLAAGAFTNITRDHLDYHATFEDYLQAKLRLFTSLLKRGSPAVIDADGPGAEAVQTAARSHGLNVITVGKTGNTLRLVSAERTGFSQNLVLECDGKTYGVRFPLTGGFQVSNGLIAAGLAIGLGMPVEAAFLQLEHLRGAKGRLEHVGETKTGAPIFIDYAHTPDALAKALEALRPYVKERLHVVFGCGGDRDAGKRPEMGRIAQHYSDVVYVTDDNPRTEDAAAIRHQILQAAPNAIEIADRTTAITTAISALHAGDVLLIAGKGHEAGQIIGTTVIPYSDHDAVAQALTDSFPSKKGSA